MSSLSSSGETAPAALDDLKIVELSNGRYEYATKLLADMGAVVLTVEPPGGNPSRYAAPFFDGAEAGEGSLRYWHHNTSKRSYVADLSTETGRTEVLNLLRSADVFVTSYTRAELSGMGFAAEDIVGVNENIVLAYLADYGPGPWESLHSSDLVQLSLGGIAGVSGYDDEPGRPPIAPSGGQAEYIGSMVAAMAILAAVRQARLSSTSVTTDVSAHEAIAVSTEMAIPFWEFQKVNVRRQTGRHAHPTHTAKWNHRCSDGKYLSALPLYLDETRFTALVGWMRDHNAQEDLEDPRYLDPTVRRRDLDHIVEVISRFFAEMPSEEAYRGAQKRRLPWAPINAPGELLDDPHLAIDRGMFPKVQVAAADRAFRFPGAPYQFSLTPWRAETPPLLGELNRAKKGTNSNVRIDR